MEDTIRGLWRWDLDGPAQRLRPFARGVRQCVDAIRDFFSAMSDCEIVKWILFVNLVIVLLYLLVHLTRRRVKKGLLLCIFMLFMPIVGPLYLLFGELAQAIQKVLGNREVSMEELSFSQRRARQILEADREKERDVVPLEEALLVSGRDNRRKSFLETIKGDEREALGVIRGAVENPDKEIAHYAASYVTDALTHVKEQEASLRKAFEENANERTCGAYARHLRQALGMGILEGMERRRYLERLEAVMLWQLENAPQDCTVEDMTVMARQWMCAGDMEKAGAWIQRLEPQRLQNLEAFKTCATYAYRCQDRDALMRQLSDVLGSSLALDSEALEWIRFFERPDRSPASGGE